MQIFPLKMLDGSSVLWSSCCCSSCYESPMMVPWGCGLPEAWAQPAPVGVLPCWGAPEVPCVQNVLWEWKKEPSFEKTSNFWVPVVFFLQLPALPLWSEISCFRKRSKQTVALPFDLLVWFYFFFAEAISSRLLSCCWKHSIVRKIVLFRPIC